MLYVTRILAFLCFLGLSNAHSLAGPVWERVRQSGELVVAVDTAWPPFQWQRADGRYDGFDVALVMEISRRLNVGIRFVSPPFSEIVAGGWDGKWDVAPSVTPTRQRAKELAFPVVYAYSLASLAVHRDNRSIRGPEDASGKRIGSVKSTEFEKYLTREPFDILGLPGVVYKIDKPVLFQFDDAASTFAALAKGDGVELDAVVDSLQTIMIEIEKGRPFRIVGSPLMFTPSALAVEKGDEEFAALLERVVEDMRAEGTLSELSDTWFGLDITQP
ncbi:MAG: transporter substrate-binding domain-containing protein [Aestuariivirga sp.]